MVYLLCAYGITFGTLLVYGIALLREGEMERKAIYVDSSPSQRV